VIRKRIKMRKREEAATETFKREVECLELLRCLSHPNIVELLCSYTYKGQHNLLFPVFPMDLDLFLKQPDRFGEFRQNTTFYSALQGLASAIDAVHNLSLNKQSHHVQLSRIGYHHDIRPKNILVSPTTFLLADFGLARLKPDDEDSRTGWKSGAGDYIAPECMDEDFTHQKVGRSIDIWSFGCMVIDIATYIERGPDGVSEFHEQRLTPSSKGKWKNHRFFEDEDIKHAVIEWLKVLLARPVDKGVRGLVRLARQMLQVTWSQRPNAPQVSRILSHLSIKAMFQATEHALEQYIKNSQHGESTQFGNMMDIWFENERLKAWGVVLGIQTDQKDSMIFEELLKSSPDIYTSFLSTLKSIYDMLETPISYQNRPPSMEAMEVSEIVSTPSPLGDGIRKLVQSLWDLVPSSSQKRMEQAWRQSSLDTDDFDILRNVEGVTRTMETPYSDIGALAAMKRLQLALECEIDTGSPEKKRLLLTTSKFQSTGYLNQFEIGWYQIPNVNYQTTPEGNPRFTPNSRQQVLVEWVLYSAAWDGQSDHEKITKIGALAELLHQPKPSSVRVLDCLGIFPPTPGSGHQGFGFVYVFPPTNRPDAVNQPKTLRKLFSEEPLLGDKFAIAQSLVLSLYELHIAGWLHKSIHSGNVLFFQYSDKIAPETLGAPYLVGFRHSRPNGKAWYTEGPAEVRTGYEHPDYHSRSDGQEVRFQRAYDYYSIGLVLLEIGFWKPLSSFRDRHPKEIEEKFRDILIRKYVPKLGPKMGSIYRDAVAACLQGVFPTIEEGYLVDSLEGFYWAVVTELGKCNVGV